MVPLLHSVYGVSTVHSGCFHDSASFGQVLLLVCNLLVTAACARLTFAGRASSASMVEQVRRAGRPTGSDGRLVALAYQTKHVASHGFR